MNGAEVLVVPMDPMTNDAQASSIREYLGALLERLWDEQDEFSGKRPFGNSDWVGHLEIALIRVGAVSGEIDEDGYLGAVDGPAADRLIRFAIAELITPAAEFR